AARPARGSTRPWRPSAGSHVLGRTDTCFAAGGSPLATSSTDTINRLVMATPPSTRACGRPPSGARGVLAVLGLVSCHRPGGWCCRRRPDPGAAPRARGDGRLVHLVAVPARWWRARRLLGAGHSRHPDGTAVAPRRGANPPPPRASPVPDRRRR